MEKRIIDGALRQQLEDKRVEERLVKQIALAYLWGLEELDSSRFAYFFETGQVDYLGDAAGLFWSFRDQLTPQQIERILIFWERCLSWGHAAKEPHAKLLSKLSLLSCYLPSIGERERSWLVTVAPYVKVGYNEHFFLEELDRLADESAANVSIVLRAFLDSYEQFIHFDDMLTSIITKIAQHDNRADAIAFAERLRMIQLYEMLTERS